MTELSEGHFGMMRLGDFDIVRELGRGGTDIVYQARQVSLNHKIALDLLGPNLEMTGKAVVRLRREAVSPAKSHRAKFVPIYATSEHDETHSFAFIERMNDDPAWPPWIPVRDENEEKDSTIHSTENGNRK